MLETLIFREIRYNENNEQLLKENSLEQPELLKFYNKLQENNIKLDVFPRKYEDLIDALKNKIGSSVNE